MPINYRINLDLHYSVSDSGCWNWVGAVTSEGYGQIRRQNLKKKAHRYFYERNVGPIPEGMLLDHLCRNRLCVNPAHLEVVSNKENVLRGFGPTAVNARKNKCKRGHELEGFQTCGANINRRCLECKKLHDRNYYNRKMNKKPKPEGKK